MARKNEVLKDYVDEVFVTKHSGSNVEIFIVRRKDTLEKRALKIFLSRGSSSDEHALDAEYEASILEELKGCPSIVEFHRIYHVNERRGGSSVIEMEAFGRDAEYFLNRARLTTMDRLQVCVDVMRGLAFMHSRNIVHLDLKQGNVLVSTREGRIRAKICDFGSSRRCTQEDAITHHVTTFTHRPPEIMLPQDQVPHPSMDMWSFGIFLAWIFSESSPITSERCLSREVDLLAGPGNEESPVRQLIYRRSMVPREYIDFVFGSLLLLDPGDRITAEEALNTPLFSDWRQ